MSKDIAIVGAWVQTRLDAPYGDPNREIWTCSYTNAGMLPRVDQWFEMHRLEAITRPEYLAFLKTLPNLYMQHRFLPNAEPYPLQAMIGRFGAQFFRNTFCYMLAWAINLKPERIGLWGIGPKSTASQRDALMSMRHFVSMARREGILVECPEFLDAPERLYGYEDEQ